MGRCTAPSALGVLVVTSILGTLLVPSTVQSGSRWARAIGGPGYERIACIRQTNEGGCVLVGSVSMDGIESWVPWVVKLDASGRTVWERSYSGGDVVLSSAEQTKDGGFVLVGETASYGAGNSDGWCMKLSSSGDVEWQRTYGGDTEDVAMAIQETPDGSYVVVGYTYPSSNQLTPDAWSFRLDRAGIVVWMRTYRGETMNFPSNVILISDGSYLVIGATFSVRTMFDVVLMKLDGSGEVVWQRRFGGLLDDFAYSTTPTNDHGSLITGSTRSFGADKLNAWVAKFDSSGNVAWQRCFGGAGMSSYSTSAIETTIGSYLLAGGSAPGGSSKGEGWLLGLDSGGNTTWKRAYASAWSTALSKLASKSDGGYLLTGTITASEGAAPNLLVMSVSSTGKIDPSCDGIGYGKPALNASESNATTVELSATVRHGPSESSLTSLVPEDATSSNALICSSPDRPDLTAAWRGVQRQGDTVSGSLVCRNLGLRAARSFKVRVVLSDDQSPDATDALVLMQTITSLPASTEASPIRIEASDDHPLEGKYLIAIVDSGSAVAEENEANNKLGKQIP